jgi:hypothetical protein
VLVQEKCPFSLHLLALAMFVQNGSGIEELNKGKGKTKAYEAHREEVAEQLFNPHKHDVCESGSLVRVKESPMESYQTILDVSSKLVGQTRLTKQIVAHFMSDETIDKKR